MGMTYESDNVFLGTFQQLDHTHQEPLHTRLHYQIQHIENQQTDGSAF